MHLVALSNAAWHAHCFDDSMNTPRPFESFLQALGVMSVVSAVILFFPAFGEPEESFKPIADRAIGETDEREATPAAPDSGPALNS